MINLLIAETCEDGLKNQDEDDVDCGGATCEACGKYLVLSTHKKTKIIIVLRCWRYIDILN